jgi:hypothetical protein
MSLLLVKPVPLWRPRFPETERFKADLPGHETVFTIEVGHVDGTLGRLHTIGHEASVNPHRLPNRY